MKNKYCRPGLEGGGRSEAFERNCPLCGSSHPEVMVEVDFTILDQGLAVKIVLGCCRECGFAFNDFSSGAGGLNAYYQNKTVLTSWRAAGENKAKQDWKSKSSIFEVLRPHLTGLDLRCVDVGCGQGTMLDCLRRNGLTRLEGVDLNGETVEYLRGQGLKAHQGEAAELPFEDGTIDVLLYIQTFEHITDLKAVVREARRVLRPGGLVCVDVPDALNYAQSPLHGCFQWLFEEHVNHIDRLHLESLLAMNGFEILDSREQARELIVPHSVEQLRYHGCVTVARLNPELPPEIRPALPGPEKFSLRDSLGALIKTNQDQAASKLALIDELVQSGRPVWLWPLSMALRYYYGQSRLAQANIKGVIDRDEKFRSLTVAGRPVRGPEALKEAGAEDSVLIFSHSQRRPMEAYLREIGFPGERVFF